MPGDEGDNRFGHVFGNEFGSVFLCAATDFADHHDRLGFSIVLLILHDISVAPRRPRKVNEIADACVMTVAERAGVFLDPGAIPLNARN